MTAPVAGRQKLGGQTVASIPATGRNRPPNADDSTPRIVVVTFPFASPSVEVLITDFMTKIGRVAPNPFLIAHSERQETSSRQWITRRIPLKMHYAVSDRLIRSSFWWVAKLLAYQLIASVHILRIGKLVDGAIFYMVGPYALGPLVTCRVFGIPTVLLVTESLEQEEDARTLVGRAVFRLRELSCLLAGSIAVESAALRQSPPLADMRWKVLSFEVPRGTNLDDFRPIHPASARQLSFGYVGRLTHQKGFPVFVQAASEVLAWKADASCVVVGSGPLAAEAESFAMQHPRGQVEYRNWVDHKRIPEIMNSLRLLVLPSQTEGLPTVVIEAMACGTPVLATRVGGIGEMIRERETGFLLNEVNPRSLAIAIESALTYPGLDAIAERARSFVTTRFSEATVEANLSRLARSLGRASQVRTRPRNRGIVEARSER